MSSKPDKKLKPRQLDKSRPYAEIFGIVGASFEQDGILFTSAGQEAKNTYEVKDEEEPDNDVDDAEIRSETIVSEPAPAEDASVDTFESMHDRHLKALVEGYGGTFESRDGAMQFLRHRPIAA